MFGLDTLNKPAVGMYRTVCYHIPHATDPHAVELAGKRPRPPRAAAAAAAAPAGERGVNNPIVRSGACCCRH